MFKAFEALLCVDASDVELGLALDSIDVFFGCGVDFLWGVRFDELRLKGLDTV